MNRGPRTRMLGALSALVVVLGACSPTDAGDEGSAGGPAAAGPSSAAPSAGAAGGGEPIEVVGSVNGESVELSVGEIVSDGSHAVLTMTAAGGPPVRLGQVWAEGVDVHPLGAFDVRLIDGDQVCLVARDGEGVRVASEGALDLAEGDQEISAVFAAPQGDEVDLLLKHVGLVAEVPVVKVDVLELPEGLELEDAASALSAPIDAYAVDVAQESATRISQGEATIAIANEVLFDVDSAELTSEATQALASSVAQVEAAGVREISVVGHTDDRGDEAHNDDLSLRRAQAVAEVLAAGLPEVAISVEGRGEHEPVVANSSASARAANRRVEIVYLESSTAGELGQPGSAEDAGELEETAGVVARSGAVSLEYSIADEPVRVAVEVTRRQGYLEGRFELTSLTEDQVVWTAPLGGSRIGFRADRAFDTLTQAGSAHAATLLTSQSRTYPLDYVDPYSQDQYRQLLTDRYRGDVIDAGTSTVYTVLWPDPGTDTVTVDVPDQFRLLDVPVADVEQP